MHVVYAELNGIKIKWFSNDADDMCVCNYYYNENVDDIVPYYFKSGQGACGDYYVISNGDGGNGRDMRLPPYEDVEKYFLAFSED